jgi:hypothetical protein
MKPTTLNHPDAPDLNFKWNGRHGIRVMRFGREVDVFTCGDPTVDHPTRADIMRGIDAYVNHQEMNR